MYHSKRTDSRTQLISRFFARIVSFAGIGATEFALQP